MMSEEQVRQLKRWRLILGQPAEQAMDRAAGGAGWGLTDEERLMDEALAALYDRVGTAADGGTGTSGAFGAAGGSAAAGGRSAGLGPSSPRVAKWLGDVRSLFPSDLVSVIQADAIERKGLKQLLLEPEMLSKVQPDIGMAATLMALRGAIPEKTKDTARQLVRTVVEELTKRLEQDLRKAVTGALNRRKHAPLPSLAGLDWKTTIRRNLRNYNADLGAIIPERTYFFDRQRRSKEWTVILDIDQSGSMASSVIYASVAGAIFSSLPSLDTRVVAFDTEVVDLTEQCANDPVDMLFGIQFGGGTDINKSVAYCEQFVADPKKTLFILISDLYEGGNQSALIRRLHELHDAGAKVLCLLALADDGVPSYDEAVAKKLSARGIPCFGCTPGLLPQFVEAALGGRDLLALAAHVSSAAGAGRQ